MSLFRGQTCYTLSMIGLHRNMLTIAEPDPCWAVLFQAERQAIARAAGSDAFRIEHIGSTSVSDLPAKPIIDIGILMDRTEDLDALRRKLLLTGYIDRGDKGDRRGYLFVREQGEDCRTHHLHVIIRGDPAWDRYLRFRDILRKNPAVRNQYAVLKRDLSHRLGNDRHGYGDAKTAFVNTILGTK